ncbi:hypothetical protein DCAR_0101018 [Daucus carota subsp. sativus]|uniref:Uncharacterized protein n=1 Tax=Daucus carota subsp. sativus TaxID=79200 RepID=A0A175YAD1_DAUCS|nr:hypothetical protein DCAR_0101018 [Daucus carota subsp. sativus]
MSYIYLSLLNQTTYTTLLYRRKHLPPNHHLLSHLLVVLHLPPPPHLQFTIVNIPPTSGLQHHLAATSVPCYVFIEAKANQDTTTT